MGRRDRDADLIALRAMVREAFLDTSSDFGRDPAVYEVHPTDLEFASYIDRLLSEAEETAFEGHVAQCSQCAEELVLLSRSARAQRRKQTSSYWKIAAGIIAFSGALIAALLAGRTTGTYVEDRLLAGLEAGLDGRASAEGVKISVLGGPKVELTGLTIEDPGGGDPIIRAPSATFEVELSELGTGNLAGTLELQDPVIHVARDTFGHLTVDSFLPGSERLASLVAAAAQRAVRTVKIDNGTIQIIDQTTSGRREIRLAAVDALLKGLSTSSPAQLRGRAGIESRTQNMVLEGRVGPWGGAGPARYRFRKFQLDQVSLDSLAWVRTVVRGGLSYEGTAETQGSGWEEISSNISGRGRVKLTSGALVGRNLVAETLRPWLRDGMVPARLAAVMAPADTPFDEIVGSVGLRSSAVSSGDLRVRGRGFDVTGGGVLGNAGELDFQGVLTVSAEISSDLVELAPLTENLLDEHQQLVVPFQLAGNWPEVRARVDLEALAARILPGPRFVVFWPTPAIPLALFAG